MIKSRLDLPSGGYAFPCGSGDLRDPAGMTLRQYAAIKLQIPDSGDEWLDDMIRKANRKEYAGQALAGYMAMPDERACPGNEDIEQWRSKVLLDDAKSMFRMADAMIETEAKDADD